MNFNFFQHISLIKKYLTISLAECKLYCFLFSLVSSWRKFQRLNKVLYSAVIKSWPQFLLPTARFHHPYSTPTLNIVASTVYCTLKKQLLTLNVSGCVVDGVFVKRMKSMM